MFDQQSNEQQKQIRSHYYRPVKPIDLGALFWLIFGLIIISAGLYGAAYVGILNSKP